MESYYQPRLPNITTVPTIKIIKDPEFGHYPHTTLLSLFFTVSSYSQFFVTIRPGKSFRNIAHLLYYICMYIDYNSQLPRLLNIPHPRFANNQPAACIHYRILEVVWILWWVRLLPVTAHHCHSLSSPPTICPIFGYAFVLIYSARTAISRSRQW